MPQEQEAPISELITTPVDVPIPAPDTPITQDVDPATLELKEPDSGITVLGPEEALGENEEEIQNEMEMKLGKPSRERDPATGKFLPKAKKEPAQQPPAKPVAQKPPVKAPEKPVVKPATPKPAPIAKVKIGDVEKTPEEWATHFKELEEKAKAAAAPPKAPEPVKTKEEVEAEKLAQDAASKQTVAEFLAERVAEFNPADYGIDLSQEAWDAAIASGNVEYVKDILAKTAAVSEMKSRQWAADAINAAHGKLAEVLKPIQEHHQRVAAYQEEQTFLATNKDIADHPQGRETASNIRRELRDYYGGLKQKAAKGEATPIEQAHLTIYEARTPEQFNEDIADHTRAALAKLPAPSPNAKPTVKPEPTPPPAGQRAKPFSGDRPNGSSSPASNPTLDEKLANEFAARP